MNEKKNNFVIIYIASIIGLAFAVMSLSGAIALGIGALLVLTIIPVLLCVSFLVKKWWICGLLYCIVFFLARLNVFLGRATILAFALCVLMVLLFARATFVVYRLKKDSVGC